MCRLFEAQKCTDMTCVTGMYNHTLSQWNSTCTLCCLKTCKYDMCNRNVLSNNFSIKLVAHFECSKYTDMTCVTGMFYHTITMFIFQQNQLKVKVRKKCVMYVQFESI